MSYANSKFGIPHICFRRINLKELADLLISWGVVNAINLDGGGSVTAVVNNTWINSGGDDW